MQTWLLFALLTVACWGLYGVFLFLGGEKMLTGTTPGDREVARYKAFLFIGVAYFITAVLAPLAMLMVRGASFTFPSAGITWSLIAGLAGAAGAFGVLLAFGAGGRPAAVMAIVFGGAPVVNAVVAITAFPPGWGKVEWPFYVGLLLAACGGLLVTLYRPAAAPPHPTTRPAVTATTPPAQT